MKESPQMQEDQMNEQKTKLTRQFMEALPHGKALDMQVAGVGDGWAELTMNYDERFVGDPETGVIHGGAISALMDTCCGAAVMSHPQLATITATIDLRIDYMRSATPHQRILCRAECYHVTRSVAFVRATAYDEDMENPVATATAAFTASANDPRDPERLKNVGDTVKGTVL